jgi:hypothetical protein
MSLSTSVAVKITRAEQHIEELKSVIAGMNPGSCRALVDDDSAAGYAFLKIRLSPQPPTDLPGIVGDIFFNLRAALDYLVWQLVLSHGAQRPGKHNSFPICTSAKAFAEACAWGCLRGVSDAAIAAIEKTQPYASGDDALSLLVALQDAERDQSLSLTAVAVLDTTIQFPGGAHLFLRNRSLRDGAILREIGLPLGGTLQSLPLTNERLETLFVSFNNSEASNLDLWRVDDLLEYLLVVVRNICEEMKHFLL